MRQAVDRFLDWKRSRGAVDSTIANYEHRLYALLDLPANDLRPVRWTLGRGKELYAASIEGRSADSHINGLSVGRMWGRYCVKERLLKQNPFEGVETVGRRNRGAHKPRLTIDESRRLEAYCLARPDDQDCILTYGYLMLGKRASELVGATVRDLDDDGWRLRITKAKTDASVGSIPLGADLRAMLTGLADGKTPDARLFVNQSGAPMSRFVARDRVRAVLKAAGVPILYPQALRRTFTDTSSMQGYSLKRIAEMDGHTSTAVTTRSYMAPEQVEAAAVERHLKIMQGGKR